MNERLIRASTGIGGAGWLLYLHDLKTGHQLMFPSFKVLEGHLEVALPHLVTRSNSE